MQRSRPDNRVFWITEGWITEGRITEGPLYYPASVCTSAIIKKNYVHPSTCPWIESAGFAGIINQLLNLTIVLKLTRKRAKYVFFIEAK